ncbi:hypothetical protein BDW75DRAFT_68858 [Aspergillus navahoensis]
MEIPSENKEECTGLLNDTDKTSQDPAIPADRPGSWKRYRRRYFILIPLLFLSVSANVTLADTLWHSINIDSGVVALPDSFAASHNLRTAQRFPWDPSQGIYILHGFHNLHCLKIIHISLFEFRNGREQSRTWHHIAHCLDALRRQILCDADDTPRATERRVEVVSGVGQHRVCRDWGE